METKDLKKINTLQTGDGPFCYKTTLGYLLYFYTSGAFVFITLIVLTKLEAHFNLFTSNNLLHVYVYPYAF